MHFKHCQVKTHVQTVHESHDLNIDFHSFDNGFKQPCAWAFYARMFFLSQFPERVYTCKEGVTAADFSRHNPSLLAVNIKFLQIYNG